MNFTRTRQIVLYVIRVILAVPISVIVTVILSPFWDWIEHATGIESLGFHGPSTWCYVVMFVATASFLMFSHRTRRRRQDDA
jgi:hypothetical protein